MNIDLEQPINLFQMDNLELLKQLPDNCVDLIYCDILYGTGRDFGDYQDLKPIRSVIEEHYTPRITEMKRILKDTGSIYLQMDTRINHWIKIIMDDIFGYTHFKNDIVWKRRSNSINVPKNSFHNNYDIITFYTKSNNYTFNQQYTPLSSERLSRFDSKDNKGRYQWSQLKSALVPLKTLVWNNKEYTSHYYITQETFDKRLSEGWEVKENSIGDLVFKYYLHESKGVPVSDLWTNLTYENANGQNLGRYQTQKPEYLLERIINASSNEGDVVADFYMGSGTTARVSKDLNRKFIGCDINPNAVEITKKRLIKPTEIKKKDEVRTVSLSDNKFQNIIKW